VVERISFHSKLSTGPKSVTPRLAGCLLANTGIAVLEKSGSFEAAGKETLVSELDDTGFDVEVVQDVYGSPPIGVLIEAVRRA
jgi:hypothetical protein